MKTDAIQKILTNHSAWLLNTGEGNAASFACEYLFRSKGLKGATLIGATLRFAVLCYSDLRFTNLYQANMIYVNLEGADLRNASLFGANLRSAHLANAKLQGANINHANLDGACLRGALYNKRTVFPVGFDPVAAGMVRVEESLWDDFVLPLWHSLTKTLLRFLDLMFSGWKTSPWNLNTKTLPATFVPSRR